MQQMGSNARYPAAGAEEEFASRVGQDVLCSASGLEGMVDHGAEGFAIEWLEVEVMHDAHGQRGVLLHAQMSRQGRQSYQPQSEQIAAIKGEVQEGGEIDEEGIGEMLCLVQNEDRCDASLIDQVQ